MDYDEPYWVEVEWDRVGPYWYRMGTGGTTDLVCVCTHCFCIVRPMKSNKGANYRVGCTPLGTKVPIYHFKAESMLNTIHNVVKLKTCAVSS